jgi:hypothetical protein
MRSRNNTVYTGKVGSKMRPLKPRREPSRKQRYECLDGPMQGYALYLSSDGATAVMNINGQVGRYNQGKWEAVCT